ncbi:MULTISPECIES: hypothetical protein [Amycolatopsis]|uniref:hypothetical protein n=1 Tax=Amycolatopsis TaxID=1813 RepID=UPI001F255E6B|nr:MULTISPECIES: hypothetical protein [Amycolatopsis]UKD53220.1 hypothetical protein L3Q65_35775 [Amycolatopsis sp. FU40]
MERVDLVGHEGLTRAQIFGRVVVPDLERIRARLGRACAAALPSTVHFVVQRFDLLRTTGVQLLKRVGCAPAAVERTGVAFADLLVNRVRVDRPAADVRLGMFGVRPAAEDAGCRTDQAADYTADHCPFRPEHGTVGGTDYRTLSSVLQRAASAVVLIPHNENLPSGPATAV